MSKNFELMRRAGNSFERQRPLQLDIKTEHSPSPGFTAPVVEHSLSDWLRALEVLQNRWRLSAVFALVVFRDGGLCHLFDHADL